MSGIAGPNPHVTIGTQTWTRSNLAVSRYRNGDPIPEIYLTEDFISQTTGAYHRWGGDPAIGNIYGYIYNWYAIFDERGLAPLGYHIPSKAEWETLGEYLGGFAVAGGKLKQAGTAYWTDPNVGADNSTGFTALPGGYVTYDAGGAYDADLNNATVWWSSTQASIDTGYVYGIANSQADLILAPFTGFDFTKLGFYVRLIVD